MWRLFKVIMIHLISVDGEVTKFCLPYCFMLNLSYCNNGSKKLLPVRTGLVVKSITSPDPGLIAFSITSPEVFRYFSEIYNILWLFFERRWRR